MNDSSCVFDIITRLFKSITTAFQSDAYVPLPESHAAAIMPGSKQRQSVKFRKNGTEKTLT